MWSGSRSLRQSVKMQNMENKLKGQSIIGNNVTIFEEGEQESCVLSVSGSQIESQSHTTQSNVAVLEKSSLCVLFYKLEVSSFFPMKAQDCKPQNCERDVLGVKFSSISTDIYYIASQESVVMYDQRLPLQIVEAFKTDIDNRTTKEINCFDINCDGRLIAAGTETSIGDAFILFWDIRYGKKKTHRSSFLGGYWESHTDDITCLAFHPTKREVLASGSTDSLMNIFDLKQSSEDEALMHSLNTESSVDRIGWLTDNSLWCTTHMETLQLWDCESADPYAKFERSDLVMSQNENVDDCYVVKVHTSNTSEPFLLAGCSTTERQYLRCLSFKNNHLEILHDLTLNNKQVVRDSWLHEKNGILLTVGEGDAVDVWKLNAIQDELVTKISVGKNNHCRSKPY